MRIGSLVGMVAVSLLVSSFAAAQAPAVDPQSLVGEWVGNVLGPTNFFYTLTIAKVEGNRVEGKAHAVGGRGIDTEYQIFGTVEGNVLKYHTADKDLEVELVIDGDKMNGTGVRKRAGASGKFSLTKKK